MITTPTAGDPRAAAVLFVVPPTDCTRSVGADGNSSRSCMAAGNRIHIVVPRVRGFDPHRCPAAIGRPGGHLKAVASMTGGPAGSAGPSGRPGRLAESLQCRPEALREGCRVDAPSDVTKYRAGAGDGIGRRRRVT